MRSLQKKIIRLLFGCLMFVGPANATGVGDPVPDFSLTGLDGRTYRLADYRGRIFVLYFLGHN
ncbi:MAG: redoxin domain-containing protein [bacterium]|nr:redoxin domain-containing protein [bacterium]